jgi:hypothetical protein
MQIKITMGSMSLEYEGDENFFRDEVGKFLERFAAQAAKSPSPAPAGTTTPDPERAALKGVASHSTNTVAKLLNAQTGPDLVMAAAAKAIIVDGSETVTRSMITSEMKKATSYYKRTFTSNLSNYLDNLTKSDSLRLVADNVYGIPAKMRETFEAKLREQ